MPEGPCLVRMRPPAGLVRASRNAVWGERCEEKLTGAFLDSVFYGAAVPYGYFSIAGRECGSLGRCRTWISDRPRLLPRPPVTWNLIDATVFASNTIVFMLPSSAMWATSMLLPSLKVSVPACVWSSGFGRSNRRTALIVTASG